MVNQHYGQSSDGMLLVGLGYAHVATLGANDHGHNDGPGSPCATDAHPVRSLA